MTPVPGPGLADLGRALAAGEAAPLLRWMDLATAVRASHLTRAAYLRWMRSFIGAQRAEYHPAWVHQVTLPTGQAVLRIGYGAPSPLS